jgi:hypothetical protein
MERRSERIKNKINITQTLNTNIDTRINSNINIDTSLINRNRNRDLNNTLNNINILKLNEEEDKKNKNTNNLNNINKKKVECEQILKKKVETKKLYLQMSKKENDYEEKNIKMRCIICFGFYNKPIMCIKCEEIFCEECIFKIKSNSSNQNNTDRIFRYLNNEIKCPHCRSHFEEKKIQKQYLEILNKIKIICPNEKPCEKIIPYEDLNTHLLTCKNSLYHYECNYCKKIFLIKSERVIKGINKNHLEACVDYKRFIEKKENSNKNNIGNISENHNQSHYHNNILRNFGRNETLHDEVVSIRRRFNGVVRNINRLVRNVNFLNRRRQRNMNNPQANNLPSFFLSRNDLDINDSSLDYSNNSYSSNDFSFSISDSLNSSYFSSSSSSSSAFSIIY